MDYGVLIRQIMGRIANLAGIGFGTGSVTFTASNTSSTATVTHGMSAAPSSVQVTVLSGVAWAHPEVIAGSVSATQFQVQMRTVDGSSPTGTKSFYWTAVR